MYDDLLSKVLETIQVNMHSRRQMSYFSRKNLSAGKNVIK